MPSTRLLLRTAAFAAACIAAPIGHAAVDAPVESSTGDGAVAPLPTRALASAPTSGLASPSTTGLASFYSQRLAGRATASGVPYDPAALTAAHRTLPLGTRLRVVNPQNDRSVVVTVNDRGPALRKRLIDLSAAAAHALGIGSTGVARVETHIVDTSAVDVLRPALAVATDAWSVAPFARH